MTITRLIPMTSVVGSSNVHSRGYDAETQTLAIRFKDKAGAPTNLYHYENVPAERVDELAEADSFGGALNALIIKNSAAYPATRITEEARGCDACSDGYLASNSDAENPDRYCSSGCESSNTGQAAA